MPTETIVQSDSAKPTRTRPQQSNRSVTADRRAQKGPQRRPSNPARRRVRDIATTGTTQIVDGRPSPLSTYSTPPVEQVQLPPREAKKPRRRNRFFESITLEKCFVMFGFLVACGMILTFGIDLATGWPFWRASITWDIAAVFCGSGLAYLSWDTYRDFR